MRRDLRDMVPRAGAYRTSSAGSPPYGADPYEEVPCFAATRRGQASWPGAGPSGWPNSRA
ncbi:hypothetical protein GCM10009592_10200 [Brachybacterium rhamnosum]